MRKQPKTFTVERMRRRPPTRPVANPRVELAGPRRIGLSVSGGTVNLSPSAGERLSRADLPKWMLRR